MIEIFATKIAKAEDWQDYKTLRTSALSKSPDVFCADGEDKFKTDAEWIKHFYALRQDGHIVLIAYQGNKAVGMAGGKPNPYQSEAFILHSLWVEPEYRGKQVAKLITADHMKHAQENGYKYVQACCKVTNKPARNFHRNLGYTGHGHPTEFRPIQAAHEVVYVRKIPQKFQQTMPSKRRAGYCLTNKI